MKVVVAIDSLKNSLTSVEAGRAIEAGVRKAYGGHPVQVIVKPLADGGEGTVEALVDGLDGQLRYVGVQGPLGEAVSCPYGICRGWKRPSLKWLGLLDWDWFHPNSAIPCIRRHMASARSWRRL